MSTPGPYEPCPRASGKKFKFCCCGKPPVSPPEERPAGEFTHSTVEGNGRGYDVYGAGEVDARTWQLVDGHFRRKGKRRE